MSPPDRPPAKELALRRSDGSCSPLRVVCRIVLRQAQKVVPRANVCILAAVANRKGVVPFKMPDVPPKRKPAQPRQY